MAKSYSLIVSAPGAEPVQFRLSEDRVDLGRAQANGIPLGVKAVSSRHCQFRRMKSGGYRIVDLDSTNGTRVNGQRVMNSAGIVLKNGDKLTFGETVEAQFIEALDGKVRKREEGEEAGRAAGWIPQPPWANTSGGPLRDDEINPVAAAVARQQGMSPKGR